jgi:asparagine synthase (glutamine-hydrolysing)
MDGHGGDYTLNPRGQTALARFLATRQVGRFFVELRGHLRLSGHSLWITLKNDIAALLLPPALIRLWRRIRRGVPPIWRDQPINDTLAERLIATHAINPAGPGVPAQNELDIRGRMTGTLAQVMNAPSPGLSWTAAFFGLELTRPFHDKRVVELALAIPEDLHVRNGRNRHLACAALRDIYPAEFQSRWRKNDDEIPDFQRMVKSVERQILADIAEMEKSEMLTRFVDFAKIRRLLASRDAEQHNSGWEQETQLAAHGFLIARYLKWFGQGNG